MDKNSHARSMTQKQETVPAIAPRSDMTEAQSLKPPALYRAPHARTIITSRASGKKGSFQTYSCIPLHLRSDVPARIP